MILNQTAVYALRAMSVLARRAPDEWMRAAELAEHTNVPVHYLGKVMRKLVVADLAHARKGHGGGFALSRTAARISVAEIMKATGVITDEADCAFGWDSCDLSNPCVLHDAWSGLRDVVERWAQATTLEQILASGERTP